ncbi:MAG TPA: glycerol-3-phosphate acyltransferase [Gemmatimonadales bacterium]|nr:glycerol-3-phosphate acyltransferase [Gemmatimonadales bacterium]
MHYLALAVAAYLLGSLPSAYLVVRWARGPDLRTVESGSVGALNAFRATGLGWVGVVVLVLDVAKGVLAVLLAGDGAGPATQSLAATMVVAGHNWPIWLKGKGGKGLAAAAGALSMLTPLSVPLWGVVWALGYALSGYIALGIVVATAVLPLLLGVLAGWAYAAASLPVCLLVLARHREKMRRLLLGTEPKHYWRRRA